MLDAGKALAEISGAELIFWGEELLQLTHPDPAAMRLSSLSSPA
jgi:hypothetical protein